MKWLLFVTSVGLLYAQSTASISGYVLDPSGAAIPGAVVSLTNSVNRFERRVVTQSDGSYSVTNLPLQNYELSAEKPGFGRHAQTVSLRSNVPVSVDVQMKLSESATTVNVTADNRALLVDPSETGTRAQMNQSDIEKLALQVGNRGIESVLLTFPGFSQNANGAIHPRGAHNQLTFVVDGMPISDQLTGAFANSVDPNAVSTVELFTGNIPAEYGNKTSAVANITTRSGQGTGNILGGTLMMSASEFSTLQTLAQVAGERGKLGFSANGSVMKSQRYLDQVSLDNLHNGGNLERGFLRLDYQATDRDILRFNSMAGRSSFELANLRSQHANGMRQRMLLEDGSAMMGWVHTLNAQTTVDVTASVRTAYSYLQPSAGDTPVTAEQGRRLTTFTLWNRVNRVQGAHTFKAGFDVQHFPMREDFRFAITDGAFNDPAGPGFIETLVAHDLTRGGRPFHFAKGAAGSLYTGFMQDNVRVGRWQFALGLRYDSYRFLVNGNQLQPRLGVSFHLKETGTVFRASYNRTFQTPPNENLLLANSEESTVLVAPDARATLGGGLAKIQPERQNFFEVGIQQAAGRRVSLNASYYHKNARDQQDNNNFFNTGIIFPMALARIRVNGVEGRVVVPNIRGFSATLSITHMRAISTPPFTGGLFIGNSAVDVLNAGPFFIDHDQTLSAQSVLQYSSRKGLFTTVSTRFDSGLVTNPSDPAQVATDPDFADLLPYVNLTSVPPRTLPRWVTDVSLGYERKKNDKRVWEATLMVSNIANTTALYNFQSLFVGTRLVQPRTVGVRMRYFF